MNLLRCSATTPGAAACATSGLQKASVIRSPGPGAETMGGGIKDLEIRRGTIGRVRRAQSESEFSLASPPLSTTENAPARFCRRFASRASATLRCSSASRFFSRCNFSCCSMRRNASSRFFSSRSHSSLHLPWRIILGLARLRGPSGLRLRSRRCRSDLVSRPSARRRVLEGAAALVFSFSGPFSTELGRAFLGSRRWRREVTKPGTN